MGEIIRGALKNMQRRLSRTLLTVSSITVGMLMVVIVAFVSSTGKAVFGKELEKMGVDGLSIRTAESGSGIGQEELAQLRSLSEVETAMPLIIEFGSASLRDQLFPSAICGIDAGATQAISLELLYGRMFRTGDIRAKDRVCIVDELLAKERYGRSNIVGKKIDLTVGGKTETYHVIGVTEAGSSVLQNLTGYIPNLTFIPYTTLQELANKNTFDQVAIRFAQNTDVQEGEKAVMKTLRRASSGRSVTYKAENLASQKERLESLMDMVSLILTLISGISLLVSGLGIMTIMLVSVGERTREIGIKKAIGASPVRISAEFLAESVVISCSGGLVGLLIGGGSAVLVMWLVGIPVTIPIGTLFALLSVEVLIGILFGVYPAVKAARLEPVDAFRSE